MEEVVSERHVVWGGAPLRRAALLVFSLFASQGEVALRCCFRDGAVVPGGSGPFSDRVSLRITVSILSPW